MRPDGQRLFYGGLPTLIEWDSAHPADSLPDAGLSLQSVHASYPRPADLELAFKAIGLAGVAVEQGVPNVKAVIATPKGTVTLESGGF